MRNILMMVVLALTAGCAAVGPDYSPPQIDLPGSFTEQNSSPIEASRLSKWWQSFDDPHLTDLIEHSLEANMELKAAFQRISAAHALYGIARADQLPTVSGNTSYARARDFFPGAQPENQWSLGGRLSWEIDLFGRIRRSVEAGSADLEGQAEQMRDLQVLTVAEVASTYLQAVSLKERLAIAERNVGAQRRSREIADNRFETGVTAGLDPAQAKLNLFSTQTIVPRLELALRRSLNRLAVLLGEDPSGVEALLPDAVVLPEVPEELMVGVPADLLRNRPDIRAAERRLAAQTARIGVAEAQRYPSVNLRGAWTWLANTPSDVFGDAIEFGSVGPLISVPIFNNGRLRSQVGAEEARARELELALRQQVLIAQEEVENALIAVIQDRQLVALLGEAAQAAASSVQFARNLYSSGKSDFQNVLDAQRSLFSLEDQGAQSRLAVLLDIVELYRSLGGGWSDEPKSETPPSP
ncbi:MAG: TolC family protein [Planctomycetota bacterium]